MMELENITWLNQVGFPQFKNEIDENWREYKAQGFRDTKQNWMEMDRRHQAARHAYTEKFGWGIVSAEALDAIADLNTPITEVFSGIGYWAYCLRQRGVDVIATDQEIWPNRNWTEILPAPADQIAAHTSANRAMMMVWPPCSTPAPTQVLELFRGDTLVHCGEYRGCTADEAFFDTLELQEWTVVRHVEIPRWPGLGDALTIYRRKSA